MEQEAFEPLGYATTHAFLNAYQAPSLKSAQPASAHVAPTTTETGSPAKADSNEVASLCVKHSRIGALSGAAAVQQ